MAVANVLHPRLCIALFIVVVLIDAAVEARNLKRRHGHRMHDYELEESIPRELSLHRFSKILDSRKRELFEKGFYNRHWSSKLDPVRNYNRNQLTNERRRNPSKRTAVDESSYEVEVKEAQNRSICSYTVTSIADDRLPFDLEQVKCNDVGSRCQNGTYYCMQTYSYVHVEGTNEKLKILNGCVCSQIFDPERSNEYND